MPDTSQQPESIKNNEAPKKRSFFGWTLNLQSKDLLDFRYNTQEEIEQLNQNIAEDDNEETNNENDVNPKDIEWTENETNLQTNLDTEETQKSDFWISDKAQINNIEPNNDLEDNNTESQKEWYEVVNSNSNDQEQLNNWEESSQEESLDFDFFDPFELDDISEESDPQPEQQDDNIQNNTEEQLDDNDTIFDPFNLEENSDSQTNEMDIPQIPNDSESNDNIEDDLNEFAVTMDSTDNIEEDTENKNADDEIVDADIIEDDVTNNEDTENRDTEDEVSDDIIEDETINDTNIENKNTDDEIVNNNIIANEVTYNEDAEDENIDNGIIEDEVSDDNIIEDENTDDDIIEDEITESENAENEITDNEDITFNNVTNESNDEIIWNDDSEINLEEWEKDEPNETIEQLTAEEIFEQEPDFFGEDELSQKFLILVQIARDIFKLEHKQWTQNPYFKIIWSKTTNSILEYYFYLIEEPNEPVDLFIKKVNTNLETGEEDEHMVQFSYNWEEKTLDIFVDEVILYEKINKSEPTESSWLDTKSILEKFTFLAETYYEKLKSEREKQQEEKAKKKHLQQIFRRF